MTGGGGRTPQLGTTPARTAAALRVGASAAWELDFWGRFRRATESSRAQLLATEWGRRAVLTTIVSQVADSYFALRSLDLQLDIARADAGLAAGVAAAHAPARERRGDVAARRA